MGRYRSYFQAQATLLRNNPTNNSRNPIIELSYGSGPLGNTKSSRYIFSLNLSGLQEQVRKGELTPQNSQRHVINIKNVVSLSSDLIGGTMNDARRGHGVTTFIYALSEGFEEGTGYDYIYNPSQSYTSDKRLEAPNWYNRKTNTPWATPGTFTAGSPIEMPDVLATSRLVMGNEDLVFDITEYINDVLFNGRVHHGLGIALSLATEDMVTESRQVITFFSKYTQAFFEPYLETHYDHQIWESRCTFFLDEINQLYLQSNRPIEEVQKVEIFDQDDRLIIRLEGSQIKRVNSQLYRVNCEIQSINYPPQVIFKDVWHVRVNGRQKKVNQEFTLLERDMFGADDDYGKDYYFSLSGIRHNESIVRSDSVNRRVTINTKRLYAGSVESDPTVEGLEYRVYTTDGRIPIEVIPPTPVNRLEDHLFFDLDFSWLIPQQYFLEVRLNNGNRVVKNTQPLRFRVLEKPGTIR